MVKQFYRNFRQLYYLQCNVTNTSRQRTKKVKQMLVGLSKFRKNSSDRILKKDKLFILIKESDKLDA